MSRKNPPPIPFEQALLVCSKSSTQKVIWTCPNCKQSDIRYFFSAKKIKLCKKCNNTLNNGMTGAFGPSNPNYGGAHSVKRFGAENPMWKGGKQNCKDCGIKLGNYSSRNKTRKYSGYCRSCCQKGTRNPSWNFTLTEKERLQKRTSEEYRTWARTVKVRDSFKCILCSSSKNLHSHHLNAYSAFPEQRYEVSNGVTLCKGCHWKFHDQYGKYKNTKEQFEEFVRAIVAPLQFQL